MAVSITTIFQNPAVIAMSVVFGMTCFLVGGVAASTWHRHLQRKGDAYQKAFNARARIASYVILAILVPSILWQLLK